MVKTYTAAWKALANAKRITCYSVVIHCALKAFFAKDTNTVTKEEIFGLVCAKAFTPVTNSVKLSNGYSEFKAVELVMRSFKYTRPSIFGLSMQEAVDTVFGGSKELYNQFEKFLNSLSKNDIKKRRAYTYIFVDVEQVEPIHQAVQAAHVAMVIGQNMEGFNSKEVYYQICKKPENLSVADLTKKLIADGFKVEQFEESDMDDRVVAIGTHPVHQHKRKWLTTSELLAF